MQYQGSKRRIAKYLIDKMIDSNKEYDYFIDTMVGGCNLIDKITSYKNINNFIGNDSNEYLIAMWQALQFGWEPPRLVEEDLYNDIKNNKNSYNKELVGYVGFLLSFGAKWFGGYRRNTAGLEIGSVERYNNMVKQSTTAYNSIMKQIKLLKNVTFTCLDYSDIFIPDNSIIYNDIPYKDTLGYSNKFEHDRFYNWCKTITRESVNVYISEYKMPDEFKEIWSKPMVQVGIDNVNNKYTKYATEKLFTTPII